MNIKYPIILFLLRFLSLTSAKFDPLNYENLQDITKTYFKLSCNLVANIGFS